jgi:Rrf2 family protein
MKISAQEEYGLRCLLRLARHSGSQALTIPEIAAAEGLSAAYVAKLLAVLRQAELIDSVRGRSGGYRLAQPPGEIRLGSLLLILGEPLYEDPNYCERHKGTASETGACVHHGACSLRGLWLTLEQWMRRALDRITVADLLQGEDRLTELLRARLADAMPEPDGGLITLTPLTKD